MIDWIHWRADVKGSETDRLIVALCRTKLASPLTL